MNHKINHPNCNSVVKNIELTLLFNIHDKNKIT